MQQDELIRKGVAKKSGFFQKSLRVLFPPALFPRPPPVLRLRTTVSIPDIFPSFLVIVVKEVSLAKVCVGRVHISLHLG